MYRLSSLRQLPSVRNQQMWSSLHSSCIESQRSAKACVLRARSIEAPLVSICVRSWHTRACQSSYSSIAQQAKNSHKGPSWLCNSAPAMTVAIESDLRQQQRSCPASEATGSAAGGPAQPAAATLQRLLPEQHVTKLLTVDPDAVPDVSSPDLSTIHDILTAQAAPDLSPSSCPHLYYHHSQPHGQQQGTAACSSSSSSSAIQQAAELLRSGNPVAIPTETVYGLAANALSASAVSAVYAAKGRPSDNPLIVHVSDLDMLAQLYPQQQQQEPTNGCTPSTNSSSHTSSCSDSNPSSGKLHFIPQQYHRLIAAFWPGPLTLLLPASPLLPAAVTAGLPTVAVRMPAHPVARALIAAAGVPLAAPSANTSGRPSPTTAQHVMQVCWLKHAAGLDSTNQYSPYHGQGSSCGVWVIVQHIRFSVGQCSLSLTLSVDGERQC
jgi:tRNA A37 threonylcarbamoyladenosine synthetase subunit TsaC/SUA5/YrdC